MRIVVISTLILFLSACATTNTVDRPVTENEKAAAINVQLGVNYLSQGEHQLADKKLRRAMKQDPRSATAHWVFALLQQRLNQNDLAEKYFRKAISLDPNDSRAYNNYGTFLCEQERINEAEKQFLKAVENPLYKEASGAYANAGICVLKLPDKIKAEQYFQQSLELNASERSALFQMALLSFERQEFDLTSHYVQRFEKVARHNSQSLWVAYQAENSLGNLGKAEQYAAQLKKSFPASQEARLLAESYWNAGRKN